MEPSTEATWQANFGGTCKRVDEINEKIKIHNYDTDIWKVKILSTENGEDSEKGMERGRVPFRGHAIRSFHGKV